MIIEEIKNITENIVNFWDVHGDPRTSKWFLTANLYPFFFISIAAIFIVKVIIPMIYKGEKQPQFRKLLALYCFIHYQISLFYVVVFGYIFLFVINFNIRCEEVVPDFEGVHYHIALISYWWAWFKTAEYIEIILGAIYNGRAPIYVVIHHILLPFTVVVFVHFYPGGPPLIFGMINNIEHVILYGALTLRTISPTLKKKSDPWFKKFHIILTEATLLVMLIFFIQLSPNEHCSFENFKVVAILILSVFLTLSIIFRWGYISHKNSFGQTKLIIFINKLLGKFDELPLFSTSTLIKSRNVKF